MIEQLLLIMQESGNTSMVSAYIINFFSNFSDNDLMLLDTVITLLLLTIFWYSLIFKKKWESSIKDYFEENLIDIITVWWIGTLLILLIWAAGVWISHIAWFLFYSEQLNDNNLLLLLNWFDNTSQYYTSSILIRNILFFIIAIAWWYNYMKYKSSWEGINFILSKNALITCIIMWLLFYTSVVVDVLNIFTNKFYNTDVKEFILYEKNEKL